MKNKLYKFLALFLVLFLVVSVPVSVHATEGSDTVDSEETLDDSATHEYTQEELDRMRQALDDNYEKERYERQKKDYYIKDLNVDITVREDNTFKIKETYVYDFVNPHHGPTRKFILNHRRIHNLADRDIFHGKQVNVHNSNIKAKVKDLKVSSNDAVAKIAESSGYTSGDTSYKTVKIGSSSKTYTGEHTYVFSYDYKIYSKDPLENADELYFNIIGTQNECPVDHASWTIRMPKDFDTSTIGFSTGSAYSHGFDEQYLKYSIDGRVITGEYLKPLNMGEGITIRGLLPEGYFTYIDYTPRAKKVLGIIIAILLVLSLPWHKLFGSHVVEVVNFYPPKNMSPVAVETVYKGYMPSKITAMIPYLANKGCFKIEEGKNKDFAFTKIERDNSDLDYAGKTFVDDLFKKKDHVTKSNLKNRFYKTIEKIKTHYNVEAKEMYDPTFSKLSFIGVFIAVIAAYIGLFVIERDILHNPDCVFSVLGFIAAIEVFIMGLLNRYKFGGRIFLNIIFIICFPFALLPVAIDEMDLTLQAYICIEVVYIICSIFTLTLADKKIRTTENQKLYGEVLGFRNFIKTAELDRLKALSVENPKYFYDILGFAYVFGLERKWISKFDSLKEYVEDPDWYYGGNLTNYYVWSTFNNSMRSTYSEMQSSPASSGGGSSGGGYSGGGFSGGGSGGGGAGAW